jgi:peptidyl-prolyl cis-trans isomerase C
MKFQRSHPIALAVSFAAAAVVIGADTKPKSASAPATATAAAQVAGAKLPPDVSATVDGEPIKNAEVEEAFARAIAGQGMQPDAVPAAEKQAAMRMLINNMISERLLSKASATVKIDAAAVEAEYTKIRDSRKSTDEEVKKELALMGMTLDGLKSNIQKQMQQRQWMEEQTKGKAAEATEAEAKDFFDKNPQHFEKPEQVRASHILLRLAPDATPEQVTAAMKKAETVVVRANKEDFAKLAAELSEEPGAAERGGDLNFFPRQGAMVEPFAEAAFKLKKDEVSPEPVRTQFGYHIIKVTDRKAAGKLTFDEVKPKILAFLNQERKRVAIEAVIAGLRSKADVQLSAAAIESPALPVPAPVGTPAQK